MKTRLRDDLLCIYLNPWDSALPHGDMGKPVGLVARSRDGAELAPLFSLAWLMEKSEKAISNDRSKLKI